MKCPRRLVAIVLLASLLAGCSGGGSPSSGNGPSDSPVAPAETVGPIPGGLPTAVVGFVGAAPRGPVYQATRVDSAQQFLLLFGDPASGALGTGGDLQDSVLAFFENGGTSAWIVRLPPTAGLAGLSGGEGPGPGLSALDPVEGLTILVVPDTIRLPRDELLVAFQTMRGYARQHRGMAILDVPTDYTPEDVLSLVPDLQGDDASFGALYYPALVSPLTGRPLPPGGFMAGVWCANDAARGVWMPPAGLDLPLRGVLGPARTIDNPLDGILNFQGVNAIRTFPGHGTVPWGARTGAPFDDLRSRYIPTRRLDSWVEASLLRQLDFTAFQQNGPALWGIVTDEAVSFLNGLWQAGALLGDSPSTAYSVTCDASNNPPEIRSQGLLVVDAWIQPYGPSVPLTYHLVLPALAP